MKVTARQKIRCTGHWTASCAAAVVAVLLAGSAGAEIYRWVDESGAVHFSQSPPSKGKAGKVDVVPHQPHVPMVKGGPERRRDETPTPGGVAAPPEATAPTAPTPAPASPPAGASAPEGKPVRPAAP